ncbi:MAG: hypothetical protein ACO4CS_12335 [bacterium]
MKLVTFLMLVSFLAGCSVVADSRWPEHCYRDKHGCQEQPKPAPIKDISKR